MSQSQNEKHINTVADMLERRSLDLDTAIRKGTRFDAEHALKEISALTELGLMLSEQTAAKRQAKAKKDRDRRAREKRKAAPRKASKKAPAEKLPWVSPE